MNTKEKILRNYYATCLLLFASVTASQATETYSGNCISFSIPEIVYTDSVEVHTGVDHIDCSNAHVTAAMKTGLFFDLILQVWKIPDDELPGFSLLSHAENLRLAGVRQVGTTFSYPVAGEASDLFPNGEMVGKITGISDLRQTDSDYPYYEIEISTATAELKEGKMFVAYRMKNNHLLRLTYTPVYRSGSAFPDIADLIFNSFTLSSEPVE